MGVRMGEKPIAVGDLVMVTRGAPCCGKGGRIGTPFRVESFDASNGWLCAYCFTPFPSDERSAAGAGNKGFRESRLIRIDPPAIPAETPEALELGA